MTKIPNFELSLDGGGLRGQIAARLLDRGFR